MTAAGGRHAEEDDPEEDATDSNSLEGNHVDAEQSTNTQQTGVEVEAPAEDQETVPDKSLDQDVEEAAEAPR